MALFVCLLLRFLEAKCTTGSMLEGLPGDRQGQGVAAAVTAVPRGEAAGTAGVAKASEGCQTGKDSIYFSYRELAALSQHTML